MPNEDGDDANCEGKSSNINKRVLAQVIAGTANSLLLLGIGCSTAISTAIIARLSSQEDIIKPTRNELSWIGSICFIIQPLGSLISGQVMEPIGRKKAMILVNVPHIIAWIMLWSAQNIAMIFVALALIGLGSGLMEAPLVSYIGEISETSTRGTMVSYSSSYGSAGVFCAYFLGTVMPWRTASAVCLAIPLATMLMVSLVPESPIWLLSKGREKDALKALCWLRGWVEPYKVDKEFKDLVAYNKNNLKCRHCGGKPDEEIDGDCPHKDLTAWEKLKEDFRLLLHKETLRPLTLVFFFFMFSTMTGFFAVKPTIVNVFRAYNVAIDAYVATTAVGLLCFAGSVTCIILVSRTGKRPLALFSISTACITALVLGIYAHIYIPADTSSYTEVDVIGEPSIFSVVLFFIMVYTHYVGLSSVSWLILSEIFPYKTRGNAIGIAASICYLWTALVMKTYINIEDALNIYGAFYLYGAISFIGIIYLYLALPETENRTYEAIEAYFTGDSSVIFADDCFIRAIKRRFVKNSMKEKVKDNPIDDIVFTEPYMPINWRGHDNSAFVDCDSNFILNAANLDFNRSLDRSKKQAKENKEDLTY